VPEELKTAELCLIAVKQESGVLQYVPEGLRTAELCLEAAKKAGKALQYVPEGLRPAELCLEAVKQSGDALGFVPNELRTAELCLIAVKQEGYALKNVPEKLKTAEVCLEAVKRQGLQLEFVPEKLRTEEICLEAVKSFGWALEYVPKKFRTAELCLEAVRQNSRALRFVPKALKEQVAAALESNETAPAAKEKPAEVGIAIDFERLKNEVLEGCADDEIEKVLEGIEKLKAMSEKEIKDIRDCWQSSNNSHLLDIEDGSAGEMARSKILEFYFDKHPEFDEDNPEYNEDAFDDFYDALDDDEKEPYILQAIQDGHGVGDNEYDQCGRDATDETAEKFGLSVKLITCLCWRGGYL
jgi:hypothetical protein